MKDVGEAKIILDIRVIRKGDGIMLSQEHYVEKRFKKFDNYDMIFVSTLYDANSQLKKNRSHPMVQSKYIHYQESVVSNEFHKTKHCICYL
jgi:hypothetical protein